MKNKFFISALVIISSYALDTYSVRANKARENVSKNSKKSIAERLFERYKPELTKKRWR